MQTRFAFAFALLAVPLSTGAAASDGAIGINQILAIAGGVTAGDAPGFPITLDAPGRYRLTSNLVVSAAGVSGIVITVPDVKLDLGGFLISGPGSCTGSGSGLSCSAVGSGRGIDGGARVALRNGSVRGFGSFGVFAGDGARVESLQVEANGAGGISVGSGSVVSDTIAANNAGPGVTALGAVVEGSAARNNEQAGFLGGRTSYVGNQASQNGRDGIDAQSDSVVRSNVARGNERTGIVVAGGSLVSDNASTSNGIDGIRAAYTDSVQRNIAVENTRYGLFLPAVDISGVMFFAAYRENVVSGNTVGAVGGGVNLGDNSCNGTTGCVGLPTSTGPIITYNQVWWGDPTLQGGQLLNAYYDLVYGSTAGVLVVGIVGSAGFSMEFLSAAAILASLPTIGAVGPLTSDVVDPTTTASGAFGGEVVALKLNIDVADAGYLEGSTGLYIGDLTICGTGLSAVDGASVRSFAAIVNTALGGGSTPNSIAELYPVLQQVNASYNEGSPSLFAQQQLFDGACP